MAKWISGKSLFLLQFASEYPDKFATNADQRRNIAQKTHTISENVSKFTIYDEKSQYILSFKRIDTGENESEILVIISNNFASIENKTKRFHFSVLWILSICSISNFYSGQKNVVCVSQTLGKWLTFKRHIRLQPNISNRGANRINFTKFFGIFEQYRYFSAQIYLNLCGFGRIAKLRDSRKCNVVREENRVRCAIHIRWLLRRTVYVMVSKW